MSRRQLYKHSFKTDWSERRYEESNLHNRRYYRMFQKEIKKKQGIKTVMFSVIDENQLKWQLRMDRRQQREFDKTNQRDAEFGQYNNSENE